jgi:hypothetical protein
MQRNALMSYSAPAGMAIVIIGILLTQPTGNAWGRVKLITLPVRERVEIQLDHPEATLVEEERIVPLVKEENQIDFSWQYADRSGHDRVSCRRTSG